MGNILLFFNISGGEIFIIVLVVYLVFGPKKIPELARMLGKGINELRRATSEVRDEINREANQVRKSIQVDEDDLFEKKHPQNRKPSKAHADSEVKAEKEESSEDKDLG
jgi:sec-independent protein translocase protein TatA